MLRQLIRPKEGGILVDASPISDMTLELHNLCNIKQDKQTLTMMIRSTFHSTRRQALPKVSHTSSTRLPNLPNKLSSIVMAKYSKVG